MIVLLECAVSDTTFRQVSAICGESVAYDLCYTDWDVNNAARSLVDGILSHPPPRGDSDELGRHPRIIDPAS